MRFKKIVCLLLLIGIQFVEGQARTEGVLYERNDDKSIDFNYAKSTPGSIYVILKFKQLTNTTSEIIKKTISGYGGPLTTLLPNNLNESIGFSYSYRILSGNIDAKPDYNFKYILPFKTERRIKVRNLSYLGKKFGGSEPKNWRSLQFLTKPNDTVYAVRKGIVVSVKDGFKSETGVKEYNYKNKSNYLIIEHEDGTRARYGVLKNNKIMVKVGDEVYPSAPIAIAGSYDNEDNSQLRLTIYYLDKNVKTLDFDEKKKETLGSRTHLYAYIDPLFIVNSDEAIKLKPNETYTAFCNNEVIEEEMTKRELKKWKKNKLLVKSK